MFSIRQMIAKVVAEYGIDGRRVFVTGLAGGAMAAAVLATYPEVFTGARSSRACHMQVPRPFPRRSTECAVTAVRLAKSLNCG